MSLFNFWWKKETEQEKNVEEQNEIVFIWKDFINNLLKKNNKKLFYQQIIQQNHKLSQKNNVLLEENIKHLLDKNNMSTELNNLNNYINEIDEVYFEILNIKKSQVQQDLILPSGLLGNLNSKSLDKFGKYENLVIEGCGLNGISSLGVLEYILEINENFVSNLKGLCGTGIGSLISLLISLDYNITDIKNILCSLDFEKFILVEESLVKKSYNLYENFGYTDSKYLDNLIKNLIFQKTNNFDYTFNDLYQNYHKKLVLAGTNINQMNIEYFSYNTTPNMKIREAIMISLCLPIICAPIEYNDNYYIDGSILDCYPLHVFDKCFPGDDEAIKEKCLPNPNTLGIMIVNKKKTGKTDNLKEYVESLYNIVMKNADKKITNRYVQRSVIININDNVDLNCDLSNDRKKIQNIIDCGYNSANTFFYYE